MAGWIVRYGRVVGGTEGGRVVTSEIQPLAPRAPFPVALPRNGRIRSLDAVAATLTAVVRLFVLRTYRFSECVGKEQALAFEAESPTILSDMLHSGRPDTAC